MKIICIGRNYVNHAKELGNQTPDEPIVFMKPESALLFSDSFSMPSFSNDIHHELEVVVKIDKVGKEISKEQAKEYYSEIALGLDFTARSIQTKLMDKGLPWEKAKAFDQSAFVSSFYPKEILTPETPFLLKKNGEIVQNGLCKNMLFSIDELIENCSKYFTLEPGDLLYTGTPEGVGVIKKGDVLEGLIVDKEVFKLTIK